MTNNTITKLMYLKRPSAFLGEEFTSPFVELSNYKYADFVFYFGGNALEEMSLVTFKLLCKAGADGEEIEIDYRARDLYGTDFRHFDKGGLQVPVGGDNEFTFGGIRVTADELAKYGADRVAIRTTAVADSQVLGCMIGICYEPRYTELDKETSGGAND